MSKQGYNNQTISQYLLGALPEAEAEVFDELSFTDSEFADALSAAEKELVDAYVQGELDDPTLEKFESHYLSSSLRREKVEFAKAFQGFVEKETGEQSAQPKAENSESENGRQKSSWFSRLKRGGAGRLALQWGAACAVVALLIGSVWLLLENSRLRRQATRTEVRRDEVSLREQELQKALEEAHSDRAEIEQELARVREERGRLEEELKRQEQQRLAEAARAANQGPPAGPGTVGVASFILAPQLRGGGQIQTISIPPQTGYVALRLQLEPNDYSLYQATLLDISTRQTLWQSGRLKALSAGDNRVLKLSFSADLLKPQAYLLRVSGLSPDGTAEILSDYSFRVVK